MRPFHETRSQCYRDISAGPLSSTVTKIKDSKIALHYLDDGFFTEPNLFDVVLRCDQSGAEHPNTSFVSASS